MAPPWLVELNGTLKEGPNKIEVLVYNTLANHYQTIPSKYKGNPQSGLLVPVKLLLTSKVSNVQTSAMPLYNE